MKFSSILMDKYKATETGSNSSRNPSVGFKILKSVQFVRKASITSYILQCIYLSAFIITYNVNTIYYLPILWSISCVILTMNFIRNREYLYHKCQKWQTLFCCSHTSDPSLLQDPDIQMASTKNIHIVVPEMDKKAKIENDEKKMEVSINSYPDPLELNHKTSSIPKQLSFRILDLLGVTTNNTDGTNSTENTDDTICRNMPTKTNIINLVSVSENVINTKKVSQKLEDNHSANAILSRTETEETKLSFFNGTSSSFSMTKTLHERVKSSSHPINLKDAYNEMKEHIINGNNLRSTQLKLTNTSSMPTPNPTPITKLNAKKNEKEESDEIDFQYSGFVDLDYDVEIEHDNQDIDGMKDE